MIKSDITDNYLISCKALFCAVLFAIVLFENTEIHAQKTNAEQITINWLNPSSERLADESSVTILRFEGGKYQLSKKSLPVYAVTKPFSGSEIIPSYKLTNALFIPLAEGEEKANLEQINSDEIVVKSEIVYDRKQPQLYISFIPFRKNAVTGKVEKLTTALMEEVKGNTERLSTPSAARFYASSSVLANGEWFKIAVTTDGIYKVTYSFLSNIGVDVSSATLDNLRLYGNGGGMVPLLNSLPRPDDLQENAIKIEDVNNNGIFDQPDYFLFYGQGPDRWVYNTSDKRYHHQQNIYSDQTFYFITLSASGSPKRITNTASEVSSPTDRQVSSFTDYAFNEKNDFNFIKSGKEWFGEQFDINLSQTFTFQFPNLVTGPVYLRSSAIGRTTVTGVNSSFNVLYNNVPVLTHIHPGVGTNTLADFATADMDSTSFNAASSTINLVYRFNQYNATSIGWLNYIELNVTRALALSGTELNFRDYNTSTSNVSFNLSASAAGLHIWNVTDRYNVTNQLYSTPQNGIVNFITKPSVTNQLEFIAFTDNAFKTPAFVEEVTNQNLHALPQADFIIVTHPDFLSEAERLAAFHRTNDNMTVNVATTANIYNEYSGGAKDVSAIRDFVKMFYDRSIPPVTLPKYLLLFGDASFDYKERIPDNTDFVPTYQSDNSLSYLSSFCTDDFLGFLDDNEGDPNLNGRIDIGIGRFPVKNSSEAKAMVDKVITYATVGNTNTTDCCIGANSTRLGDWRNVLCFIGDDEDGTTHIGQSERIINVLHGLHPEYNIDKINFDAYQQVSTPGGERYPEVSDLIDKRMSKGALLVNYTGHGGEVGWAHERVLSVSMINAWNNINVMPAFVTATCEFSRFDDPLRTSAGELVLLNPDGGGICLYTTVRVAFSTTNEALNTSFVRHLFKPVNGEMPRLGDIYRLTKADNIGVENFVLLGDPALRLAYPKYKVSTSSIEDAMTQQQVDTLQALSRISVKGMVTDNSGVKLNNFNGVVYPTIYDKEITVNTLQNDAESGPFVFKQRKNIIYRGKASVINGDFNCTFIVPKDIAYQYGSGRLSYYAHNGLEDAIGHDENFNIGGISNTVLNDVAGPSVKIYLNSEDFVSGGMTNNSPSILAVLTDSSGINTVGNGIGHDITATLDNKQSDLYILNDYYESDLDNFQKGKVIYPLKDVPAGRHTLELKAWDINNNSSKVSTEFVVAETAELALEKVLNYPNPFTTHTSFMFEHNQPCVSMWVQVQVFTVSGKLVKTLDEYVFNQGFRNVSVQWDGKDDYGDPIGKGVYIYRLKVKTAEGETADKFERLVILK